MLWIEHSHIDKFLPSLREIMKEGITRRKCGIIPHTPISHLDDYTNTERLPKAGNYGNTDSSPKIRDYTDINDELPRIRSCTNSENFASGRSGYLKQTPWEVFDEKRKVELFDEKRRVNFVALNEQRKMSACSIECNRRLSIATANHPRKISLGTVNENRIFKEDRTDKVGTTNQNRKLSTNNIRKLSTGSANYARKVVNDKANERRKVSFGSPSQNRKPRAKKLSFCDGSYPSERAVQKVSCTLEVTEMMEDFEPLPDTRQIYRNILLDIYQEEENEKRQLRESRAVTIKVSEEEGKGNYFFALLLYMAAEHETLLEVLIFLPLLLMGFYIVFIEKGSLIRVINK